MTEELKDLLEHIYRSSGWGHNVFEDQAKAILAGYVVIPRPTAGTVTEERIKGSDDGRQQMIDGKYWSSNPDIQFWREAAKTNQEDVAYATAKLTEVLSCAVNDEAVLKYFEAKELAEKESQSARAKRRDELANEMAPRDCGLRENWYANVSKGLQNAIDRIIELEEVAK